MNANENWAFRPTHVKMAAALLVLDLVLVVTNMMVHGGMPPRPPEISAAANLLVPGGLLGVMLLWIWLIYQGRNWACWLYLAWFAWNVFFAPWHVHWDLAELRVKVCVHLALQLAALALLFLPGASRWFGRHVEAA